MAVIRHKEAIHSGQFMVSEFEADEEDVEDIPEVVGDISNSIKEPPRGRLSQKPHHDKDFLSPQNKDNHHDPQWKGGGNRTLYMNNKKNLANEQYKDRNEKNFLKHQHCIIKRHQIDELFLILFELQNIYQQ